MFHTLTHPFRRPDGLPWRWPGLPLRMAGILGVAIGLFLLLYSCVQALE